METTYKKEYDEMLIKHMSQGYSFESFASIIGKGRRTLFDWVDNFKSFKEAKDIGDANGKRFFETVLISKIRGKGIDGIDLKASDTSCLIFALKTRYRDTYSEKIDVVASGEIKINIDKDDAQL